MSKIRISDTESFLKIWQAQTPEEVQTILMTIPPEFVSAGLNGEMDMGRRACPPATPTGGGET